MMKLPANKIILSVFLGITALGGATAQCNDWKWPENRKKAEEMNVLYTDALRMNDVEAAKKPHRWLLDNAPDLNTAIYINGEKIYKELMEATEDEAQQEAYFDTLMLIYDRRVKYCGEEKEVIVRKAYQTYRHHVKKKDELKNILDLFDKAYALNGNDLDYYVILPYMSVVVYNALYLKNLTESEILERYDNITGIIDHQINEGKKVDKLTEYRNKVDGLLTKVVEVDCDFVRENLGPKFEENPEDLKMAKKIFAFMLNGKCTDDPLWLKAGIKIQEEEPEYGLAKNLGIKFKGEDNRIAAGYFEQALELTDEAEKQADIYLTLGSMKSGAAAREMYRKALAADPSRKEAYTAIGFLYYQSFETCAGKSDIVKDRSVFLAAYDMFAKGGNSKAMQSAQEQFPSKEEVFTYNYTAGKSIGTGCWIDETTTIRTRD